MEYERVTIVVHNETPIGGVMKQVIDYHDVKAVCSSCGRGYDIRSTVPGDAMTVEVCSNCHPFYTGRRTVIDSEGAVKRFKARYGSK